MRWRELVMEFCRNRPEDEAWWRRGQLCPYHDAFEDGLLYAIEHPYDLLAETSTENILQEASMRLHNNFGLDGLGVGEIVRHFLDMIEKGVVKENE